MLDFVIIDMDLVLISIVYDHVVTQKIRHSSFFEKRLFYCKQICGIYLSMLRCLMQVHQFKYLQDHKDHSVVASQTNNDHNSSILL